MKTKMKMKTQTQNKVFEFDLIFTRPSDMDDLGLSDALFEAGLDDGVIGLGEAGLFAVSLERSGEEAEAVIEVAIRQIVKAVPNAILREVKPDLASQAEIAGRLGVTRQALQKRKMPAPSLGGLYRVKEVESALGASSGKIAERLAAAEPWFRAAEGAQRLNAKLALEES
ncbi:MAG: hypothetical protein ACPG06_10660 [Alphaproteobacteria bacterium]